MTILDPQPSVDEIEGLIARNEKILALWKANPDYSRGLMIELCALHLLLDHVQFKWSDILDRIHNRIHDAPMPTEQLLDDAEDEITRLHELLRK